MIWFLRSLRQKVRADKGVFTGNMKQNRIYFFFFQYSSITANHQETEAGSYSSKSQILRQNLLILCPLSTPAPPPAPLPVAPREASEGTAPARPPHTRTAHSHTHITHLLHRYIFKSLLLGFIHQKGFSNDNTKAFCSFCAWELEFQRRYGLIYNEQCRWRDRRWRG